MEARLDPIPSPPGGEFFPAVHAGGNSGRRLVVISPHLDDAVFGCGDAIASHPGSTVVTIFAGGPADWQEPTPWDAAAGFHRGEDAMVRRREEDRAALLHLGAGPRWLPFWDRQYRHTPTVGEIRTHLANVIAEAAPHAVFIPLGLWHADHRLAHEAAVKLIPHFPTLEWFAYEDAIYRRFPDAGKAGRHEDLRRHGLEPTWVDPGTPASEAKRRGVACYRSQLRALNSPGQPGWIDALEPELYWALRSPWKSS